jgi:predicted negative regulator of RcsB-dependent stress response
VRAETRHQLKEDRFSKVTMHAAEATVHWSVKHRLAVSIIAIVLIILIGGGFGSWYYFNQQDQAASILLNQAIRTQNEPVRAPGQPPQPDSPSFASAQERDAQSRKQFQAIVDKYPHTRSADFARYFLGVSDSESGNAAKAEQELKSVAGSHNSGLSSLAKFALASVYRRSNRDKDAIEIYKDLAAHPTLTVGKTMAQMELAATYQSAGLSQDAKNLYEEIQKENPSSAAAQMASARLQDLK